MHRELNPQLFGTRSNDRSGLSTDGPGPGSSPASNSPLSARPDARGTPGYLPLEIKALEAQIHGLKAQMQTMEKRLESMASHMQELVSNTQTRFERASQAMARLEDGLSKQQQDSSSRYATLASRLNERKAIDTKVQEMIDRHNLIVRNFENRLATLQKIMSDQEMQMHNSSAALEETRQELARLKRL